MPESYTINVKGRLVDLGEPQVMGVLNATPDSFYSGSRNQTERAIAMRANQIVSEGGAIIDVGACSTRPGAGKVSEEEEAARMRQALSTVRREQPEAILSVDTFRPDVARMAAEEFGADIINDVSGGRAGGITGGEDSRAESATDTEFWKDGDENGIPPMFLMAARLRLPYVLMSAKPTVEAIMMEYSRSIRMLKLAGVRDIILDPGFGFGKTLEQNYAVLANLHKLEAMCMPVLAGMSRKSMIYNLIQTSPEEALNGTTVLNTAALLQGCVSILRVHDVKQCVEAVKIVKALRAAGLNEGGAICPSATPQTSHPSTQPQADAK